MWKKIANKDVTLREVSQEMADARAFKISLFQHSIRAHQKWFGIFFKNLRFNFKKILFSKFHYNIWILKIKCRNP